MKHLWWIIIVAGLVWIFWPSIKPVLPQHRHIPILEEKKAVEQIKLGGLICPDGQQEVQCPIPSSERLENVGGRDGAGLCVFTSITHAGRWQNEQELFDFQQKMRKELGGGYPEKVTKMIQKYAKDVKVVQYEGKDPQIIWDALSTGRMPCVTYDGHDPHYRGTIAHMVNSIGHCGKWVCVLDNNFIQDKDLVWLTEDDFVKRWLGNGGGWVVILIHSPPPPVPWN